MSTPVGYQRLYGGAARSSSSSVHGSPSRVHASSSGRHSSAYKRRSHSSGSVASYPQLPPAAAGGDDPRASPIPLHPGNIANPFSRVRVADITPTHTVEGTARYVEVLSDRVAWTAEADGSIRARALPKGNVIRTLEGKEGTFCTCLLHLPQLKRVWAAFSDGFVRVFDSESYFLEREFVQHDGGINCMVELEGKVFTGGADWKVYQWDPSLCHYERLFYGHSNGVRCFTAYTGATGAVLFSGSDDGTIKAWDPYCPLQTSDDRACIHTFTGHSRSVLAIEMVTHKTQLWSGGEDGTIRVWDLETLQGVATFRQHQAPVCALAAVELRMWSGDKLGAVYLWDLKSLAPIADLSERMRVPHRMVLSIKKVVPSSLWKVWTTGSSGIIQCWNAECQPMVFEGPSATSGDDLRHLRESLAKAEDTVHSLELQLHRANRDIVELRTGSRCDLYEGQQEIQKLQEETESLRRELQKLRQGPRRSTQVAVVGALNPLLLTEKVTSTTSIAREDESAVSEASGSLTPRASREEAFAALQLQLASYDERLQNLTKELEEARAMARELQAENRRLSDLLRAQVVEHAPGVKPQPASEPPTWASQPQEAANSGEAAKGSRVAARSKAIQQALRASTSAELREAFHAAQSGDVPAARRSPSHASSPVRQASEPLDADSEADYLDPVVSRHSRAFEGPQWQALIREKPHEFTDTFIGETSVALCVPIHDVYGPFVDTARGVVEFAVRHDPRLTVDWIDARLRIFPYGRVAGLLARRHEKKVGLDLAADTIKSLQEVVKVKDRQLQEMQHNLNATSHGQNDTTSTADTISVTSPPQVQYLYLASASRLSPSQSAEPADLEDEEYGTSSRRHLFERIMELEKALKCVEGERNTLELRIKRMTSNSPALPSPSRSEENLTHSVEGTASFTLEHPHTRWHIRINDLEAENDRLTHDFKAAQAELDSTLEHLNELVAANEELKTQLRGVEEHVTALEELRATLNERLRSSRVECDEKDQRLANLKSRLVEMDARADGMKHFSEDMESQYHRMASELDDSKQEIAALQSKLVSAQQLVHQLQEAEQERQQREEDTILALREDVAVAKQASDSIVGDLAAARAARDDVVQQLAAANSACERLQEELAAVREEAGAQASALATATQLNEQQHAKHLDDLARAVGQLEADLASEKQLSAQLHASGAAAAQACRSLEERLVEAQRMHDTLLADRSSAVQEGERARRELEEVLRVGEDLRADLRAACNVRDELRADLAAAQQANEALRADLITAGETNRHLLTELRDSTEKNAELTKELSAAADRERMQAEKGSTTTGEDLACEGSSEALIRKNVAVAGTEDGGSADAPLDIAELRRLQAEELATAKVVIITQAAELLACRKLNKDQSIEIYRLSSKLESWKDTVGQLREAEEHIAALETCRETMEKDLSECRRALEEKERTLSERVAELEQHSTRGSQRDAEVAALRREKERLGIELRKLRDALNSSANESMEVVALRSELQTMNTEAGSMARKLAELEQAKVALERQAHELSGALAAARSATAALQQGKDEDAVTIRSLEAEARSLRGSLDQAQQRLVGIEEGTAAAELGKTAAAQDLQGQLRHPCAGSKGAEELLAEKGAEVEALRKRNERSVESLGKLKAALASTEQKMAKLEAAVKLLESECGRLKAELAAGQQEREEALRREQCALDTAKDAGARCLALGAENAALQASRADVEKTCSSLSDTLSSAKAQEKLRSAERQKMLDKQKELERQVRAARSERLQCDDELVKLKAEVEALKRVSSDHEHTSRSAEQQLAAARAELHRVGALEKERREAADVLERIVIDLEKALRHQEQLCETLERDKEELAGRLSATERELSDASHTVTQYTERVRETQAAIEGAIARETELTESLRERQEQLDQLAAKLAQAKQVALQHSNECKVLQAGLAEQVSLRKEAFQRLLECDDAKKSAEAHCEALCAEMSLVAKEHDVERRAQQHFKDQLRDYTKQADLAHAKSRELAAELATLRGALEKVEAERDEARAKLTVLEGKVNRAMACIAGAVGHGTAVVAATEWTIRDLEKEFQHIQEMCRADWSTARDRESAQLQHLHECQRKLSEGERRVQQLQSELELLGSAHTRDVSEKDIALSRAHYELVETKRKLSAVTQAEPPHDDHAVQNLAMAVRLSDAEAVVQDLRASLEDAMRTKQNLEDECETLRRTLLLAQPDSDDRKLLSRVVELERIARDYMRLQEDVKSLRDSKAQGELHLRRMNEEKQQLAARITELDRALVRRPE